MVKGSGLAVAAVATGGVFGAAAREAVDQALKTPANHFPVATFLINLAGAFLLGLLLDTLGHHSREGTVVPVRLIAGTGFLGAFTTYSTFAVDAVDLVRTGHVELAVGYVAATVVGGLIAAWAGIRLGRPVGFLPLDPDIEGDS